MVVAKNMGQSLVLAEWPFPLLRSTLVGFEFELPQAGPILINKTKHRLKPCPTVVPSA